MNRTKATIEKEMVLRTLDLMMVVRAWMDEQQAVPLQLILTYNKLVDSLNSLGYSQEKHYGDETMLQKH